MKKRRITLFISFISISIILFSFDNKRETLKRYLINPNLDDTNFRTFKSNNDKIDNVLFKQIIEKNKNDKGVRIEYYFLTIDSIPFLGGIESVNKNKVEILNQFIYLDNRKIQANKITGEVWYPLSEQEKIITIEHFDKKSGFGFESISEANGRIKDTLNKSSFIVEYKTKTLFLKDGEKYDEILSKVKRLYVKDKGLIFYSEFVNGNKTEYHLIEKN